MNACTCRPHSKWTDDPHYICPACEEAQLVDRIDAACTDAYAEGRSDQYADDKAELARMLAAMHGAMPAVQWASEKDAQFDAAADALHAAIKSLGGLNRETRSGAAEARKSDEPGAASPSKRWPFVETPGEFTERLRAAIAEFGDLLPAVRNVLIETPPALAAVPGAASPEPVAWIGQYEWSVLTEKKHGAMVYPDQTMPEPYARPLYAAVPERVADSAEPLGNESERFGQAVQRPVPSPCIGNDPACPCQDGDACHYRDAADGTKGWTP